MSDDRVNARVPPRLKRKAIKSPHSITEMIIDGLERNLEDEMKIKSDLEKTDIEVQRWRNELRRAREGYNEAIDKAEAQARQLHNLQSEVGEYEEWLDDLLDRADGDAGARLNNVVIRAQDEREFFDVTVEDIKVDLKRRAIQQERDIKGSQFADGDVKSYRSEPPLHARYRIDENDEIVERQTTKQQHEENNEDETNEKNPTIEWTIEEVEEFLDNGWSVDDIDWSGVEGTPDDLDDQYHESTMTEVAVAD